MDYASRLREIDSSIKELSSEKDLIRQTLIDDASGQSSKGCGITLSKSFSSRKVRYKEIPELKDVDLHKYSSVPKECWTLRLSKVV